MNGCLQAPKYNAALKLAQLISLEVMAINILNRKYMLRIK